MNLIYFNQIVLEYKHEQNTKLKRSLGLPLVVLYGLGNILGAGIYVLVGKVAGFAGTSTTLAFLIALAIAAFTGFSYMELAGRYPVSASVSVYLYKAFGKRWLSVFVGLAMVAGGIASAAALAQGFAGYLHSFIAIPTIVGSIGLLVVLGVIAIRGVSASAKTAALFTIIEVFGLLLVIWFGKHSFSHIDAGSVFTIDPSVGLSGVVSGAFLAFYAFNGFEDMVNVSEETKNPRRTMPLAILLSLAISATLYILVVMVSTSLVSPTELAKSSAPLTLVFERSGASATSLLSLIGMVSIINGVIVQIIMGSRILYGLAKQGWISNIFATVHEKYQTPTVATLVVLGVMILGTVFFSIVSLAQITSLLILSIFTLVNVALIVIKRRGTKHQGYITVPSIVPYIGVVLNVTAVIYQVVNWARL